MSIQIKLRNSCKQAVKHEPVPYNNNYNNNNNNNKPFIKEGEKDTMPLWLTCIYLQLYIYEGYTITVLALRLSYI